MVVFSGFAGAFVLLPIGYPLVNLVILFSSMAITMAANAFNQIIERDIDGLMHRTKSSSSFGVSTLGGLYFCWTVSVIGSWALFLF